MTKYFCDMCGQPAQRAETIHYTKTPNPRLEGFDSKAKIQLTFSFNYVDHSTGYGGPPDLCKNCKILLVEEARGKL